MMFLPVVTNIRSSKKALSNIVLVLLLERPSEAYTKRHRSPPPSGSMTQGPSFPRWQKLTKIWVIQNAPTGPSNKQHTYACEHNVSVRQLLVGRIFSDFHVAQSKQNRGPCLIKNNTHRVLNFASSSIHPQNVLCNQWNAGGGGIKGTLKRNTTTEYSCR